MTPAEESYANVCNVMRRRKVAELERALMFDPYNLDLEERNRREWEIEQRGKTAPVEPPVQDEPEVVHGKEARI